jgi:hypothetical protein
MQESRDTTVPDYARPFADSELGTDENVPDVLLWAEKAKQHSDRVAGGNTHHIRIFMDRSPIVPTVVKLGRVTSARASVAPAGLGTQERNFRLDVWWMGEGAIWSVDRHRPNENKMSDGGRGRAHVSDNK